MVLRELNINPVIELVNKIVQENGTKRGNILTEHDALEIRVGPRVHDVLGVHISPFGRVIMEVPSGYLIVRTEPTPSYEGKKYIKKYLPEHEAFMKEIALELSKTHDVVYIHGLTLEHALKEECKY